jgi:hypothetical protein
MRGFTYHGSVGPTRGRRHALRLKRRYDQKAYCKNRDRVENIVRGKLSAKGYSQRAINKMILPKWAANLEKGQKNEDSNEIPSAE